MMQVAISIAASNCSKQVAEVGSELRVLTWLTHAFCLVTILQQTRSRPRKYESATRGSQKLRVRKGNRAGAPGGVSAAGMGQIIRRSETEIE